MGVFNIENRKLGQGSVPNADTLPSTMGGRIVWSVLSCLAIAHLVLGSNYYSTTSHVLQVFVKAFAGVSISIIIKKRDWAQPE